MLALGSNSDITPHSLRVPHSNYYNHDLINILVSTNLIRVQWTLLKLYLFPGTYFNSLNMGTEPYFYMVNLLALLYIYIRKQSFHCHFLLNYMCVCRTRYGEKWKRATLPDSLPPVLLCGAPNTISYQRK